MKVLAPCLTVLAAALAPASAFAECTALGTKKDYVAIFEGTVGKIADATSNRGVVTIEVHRVWKGKVGSTATAYFYRGLDVQPDLRVGERRVFFIIPLEPDVKALGRDTARLEWLVPCHGAQLPEGRIVNPLGRPWRP